jgi:hypothetical protein
VSTTKSKIVYQQQIQNKSSSYSEVTAVSEKNRKHAVSEEDEDESKSSHLGKSDKLGFFEDLFQI